MAFKRGVACLFSGREREGEREVVELDGWGAHERRQREEPCVQESSGPDMHCRSGLLSSYSSILLPS